ncbi:MAG: hypothetical protein AB7N99_08785, partial [Simkaniaceae bacterium]
LAKEIKTIYANLKAKKEDYQKGLKAFESAAAPLGYKLIDLESRSGGLTSRLSKEKFRLAEQDREAASLRNEIDALESEMGPLRPQSYSQEEELQKMHERIAKLKDQWPNAFGRFTKSIAEFLSPQKTPPTYSYTSYGAPSSSVDHYQVRHEMNQKYSKIQESQNNAFCASIAASSARSREFRKHYLH